MVATWEEWDTVAKRGISVASHRGGSKDDLDNYRFVVLLSAISRVLAKVIGIAICVFLRGQKLRRSFPAQLGLSQTSINSTQDALFTACLLVEMAAEVRKDPEYDWNEFLVFTLC